MQLRPRWPTFVMTLVLVVSLAHPLIAQVNETPLRDLTGHNVTEAQLRSAVASRTLTWLTGTSAQNDYVSVGRMANFFGFVAFRVSSGQSLTRAAVARDTLAVLSPAQIDILVALLDEQGAPHAATQAARIEMNRALERLLVGEEVSLTEFVALGQKYGAAEAQLGRVIAQRLGEIAVTLTTDQRDSFAAIRAAHASGQPDTLPVLGARVRLPDVDRQELVNLAARLLSWATGSTELNDFEVVGKPSQHFGFVSLRLASGHAVRRGAVAGEVLDLLTRDQRRMLDTSVEQNAEAFPDFLTVRSKLMRELEVALSGATIDPDTVHRLGAEVGKIEARMTWAQANAMLAVRTSMSSQQLEALLAMRAAYTVAETEQGPRSYLDPGRHLFAQCVLCHTPSRDTAAAPNLAGLLGRPIAADRAFDDYSPALRNFARSEGSWTLGLLDTFLRSPRALVPGTTMGFDGLASQDDRAAILEYLSNLE